MTNITRRRFLADSAAATTAAIAAPTILTSLASGRPAPSDRLTMALIGCGGMGNANLNALMNKAEVQVVACCDPDRERRIATRRSVEEHYADEARSGSWSGCRDYNDFRDVLGRDDIDAVIIATPDHWHATIAILAARAGKDMYCEKPLCHNIAEGRAMSDAIAKHNRVFQTGSQQRSDSRFRQACELVRNGYLGKLHHITVGLPPGRQSPNYPAIPAPEGFDYDMWLGPAPYAPYCQNRTHFDFRYILDYSGGILTDWGAHHIDIAQWALGRTHTGPVTYKGEGHYPTDGLWNAATEWSYDATYDDGLVMTIRSNPPGNDASQGVRFEGERGTLYVRRGHIEASPSSILETKLTGTDKRLPVSNDHHQNFLDCVRSRKTPIAPVEDAHRTISVAHLGNIAMRTGRTIKWDPSSEQIINDAGASHMLGRTPRGEWQL